MNQQLLAELHKQQLITDAELNAIKTQQHQPLSVHKELVVLLYAGILMLTTGAGILIYKNINTIGHEILIILLTIACIACFAWCIKTGKGFSVYKIESPSILFDYIILLGCLLMIILIAYIQYEYNVFGNRYGLATFIPMVILFITAYYFDHLGILSLAITNLCAWAGITVTPLQILKSNDFGNKNLIYTGIVLGVALIGFSYLTLKQKIKPHFSFTYKNFGAHLLFISLLAGMFYYTNTYFIWVIAIVGAAYLFYNSALREHSFYFLIITFLYAYVALSYAVIRILFLMDDVGAIYLLAMYFIASGIGLIRLLMHYNKKLNQDAGL